MRDTLGLLAAIGLVVAVAFVSGSSALWFLLWLFGLSAAAAYLLVRRGLDGLEAGAWADRQQASVGDVLTMTYTLRSRARMPKPWLEVHSPSTLPVTIPGRVVALGPRTERTWAARVPLAERGQFRIDPLVVKTGDPFGFFESVASVGPGANILVYPPVAPLPAWNLPTATIEGSSSRAVQGSHRTSMVTSVRPYTPDDAFNRIHWRSTARHGDLQVKEFDVEPSADLRIFLDLCARVHVGGGTTATLETAVSVVAALAVHALGERRGVGLEAVGTRRAVIATDRGARQRHKILSLLAVAQAEGQTTLAEMLIEAGGRGRRGTVALVVTPSVDVSWVRPLAALRRAGASPVACLIDPLAHLEATAAAEGAQPLLPEVRESLDRDMRALRRALTEQDIPSHVVRPGRPLGVQLTDDRASGREARP